MNELGLLYRYLPSELAPPDELWGRLVKVLDDTERKSFEKIESLEIQPPVSAWDNIVSALDENDTPNASPSFAETFLAIEVTPPVFVWEKIERLLDAETPVRKITGQSTTIRRVLTGLAIAACMASAIFLFVPKTYKQRATKHTAQVANVNKLDNKTQQYTNTPSISHNSLPKPNTIIKKPNAESLVITSLPNFNSYPFDSARDLNLKKYKLVAIPNIISTNNKVASIKGKIKDAKGNIIIRIGDYFTGGNYIAAIGPNGNEVNVSVRLADMIEFFQEDSTRGRTEEYLDKVIRESNVWRKKFMEWKKKVDAADAKPSQLNFLDPIDLMHFLEKNK